LCAPIDELTADSLSQITKGSAPLFCAQNRRFAALERAASGNRCWHLAPDPNFQHAHSYAANCHRRQKSKNLIEIRVSFLVTLEKLVSVEKILNF